MDGEAVNARTAFLVRQEVERLKGVLGTRPSGWKTRAVTAVVRNLLLNSPFTYNGRICDVVAKSLGAGVWEIELRKEK